MPRRALKRAPPTRLQMRTLNASTHPPRAFKRALDDLEQRALKRAPPTCPQMRTLNASMRPQTRTLNASTHPPRAFKRAPSTTLRRVLKLAPSNAPSTTSNMHTLDARRALKRALKISKLFYCFFFVSELFLGLLCASWDAT